MWANPLIFIAVFAYKITAPFKRLRRKGLTIMHSSASDGTDTPAQLVEKIKDLHIRAFSVTDHDTVDGINAVKKSCLRTLHSFRASSFPALHRLASVISLGTITT